MTIQNIFERILPRLHGSALIIALLVSALVCVGLFFGLNALPGRTRTLVIRIATFLSGLYYALEWMLPATAATPGASRTNSLSFALPTVGNILNVLVAFTLMLGIFSLLRVHGTKVAFQRKDWGYSAALLISLVVMAVAGLGFPDSVFYHSLFQDVFANYEAAMFASLAFFILNAAYRAFRVRSAEATLLMASALLVMLGQVPLGQAITAGLPQKGSFVSLFRLDNISNWLLTSVNTPSSRAIEFGLGVGLLAIGLRVWLSLERGAYFDAKAD